VSKSAPALRTLLVVLISSTGCGGGKSNPAAPSSNTPAVIQGTVTLGAFQFAVVNFRADRAGSLSSQVDWVNASNDIDTAIVRGRCTVDQIVAEAPGCNEAAAVVTDEGYAKPSAFSPSVDTGDHALIIFNWGPGAESSSYRLQGNISGGSAPATSPVLLPPTSTPTPPAGPRRTDTFAWTLPAGSQTSVLTGSVRAANGPLEVKLDFAGDYIILACVGTANRCIPMGGRPQTRTFSIPGDFPAGTIQATVYFNRNFPQPAGDARGTVAFTYTSIAAASVVGK
jgi:hypothetical protein